MWFYIDLDYVYSNTINMHCIYQTPEIPNSILGYFLKAFFLGYLFFKSFNSSGMELGDLSCLSYAQYVKNQQN